MLGELTMREVGSTFRIAFNGRTGTAFLRHSPSGSYFVTAAHNLQGAVAGDRILFQRDNDWHSTGLQYLARDPAGYDVCVFSVDNLIVEMDDRAVAPPKGVGLGEALIFLGFPHGLVNSFPSNGYPPPLARRAFFSGVVKIDGLDVLVLDGFNNPGFSGGPIYHFNDKGEPGLFGVISGYRTEQPSHGRIYRKSDNQEEEVLPDLYTKPNSGMILAIGMYFVNGLAAKIEKFNPSE